MKSLMVLLTGGAALTLAAALMMNESRAAEQDKPKRESKAADSPEARKRDPAPESARAQRERKPRDADQRERGPRDGAPQDRGPRDAAQRNRSPQVRGPGRGFDPRRFPLMVALDADRDGQLSAQEIKNAPTALKKLDKNDDGKLTPDELRPQFGGPGGPAGMGGPRPGNDQSGGRPRGQDMVKKLMAMDANADGKITKDEMPERMQQMFDRIDTNADGAVDKDEAQKLAERFNRGDRQPGGQRGARQDGDRPSRPQPPEKK